jgi:acetolactate synthase-1/2/3 large subunit
MLYLGGGVVQSDAAAAAMTLAERASIPSVMTLMALGAMPSDHPLSLGMLGMHGARSTNMALDECDLLLAVGARFDDRATGLPEQFCPEARVVHIDIDPAEIGKIRRPDVGIVSDVRVALEWLLACLPRRRHASWQRRIDALRRAHPPRARDPSEWHTPQGLIGAVAARAAHDAIIVTDVGQHQMWVAQSYPLRGGRRWLTSGGLGTMGFGLPAAIGAALVDRERTVLCFTGDGSLMMNVQELATAAEQQANVKVILLNNGGLGLVHQQQSMFYGGRSFAARFTAQPSFPRLAEAFGVRATDLDSAADPLGALHEALSAYGPWLVHVTIDPSAHVLPMVPPGAGNLQMIGD